MSLLFWYHEVIIFAITAVILYILYRKDLKNDDGTF